METTVEKRVALTILQILQTERHAAVANLLNAHRQEILATNFFDQVTILQSGVDSVFFAMLLQPKSAEDWSAYNSGPRPAIREWFLKNLIEPGLIKVSDSWEIGWQFAETLFAIERLTAGAISSTGDSVLANTGFQLRSLILSLNDEELKIAKSYLKEHYWLPSPWNAGSY